MAEWRTRGREGPPAFVRERLPSALQVCSSARGIWTTFQLPVASLAGRPVRELPPEGPPLGLSLLLRGVCVLEVPRAAVTPR